MIGPFARRDMVEVTAKHFRFRITSRFTDLPDASRWCQDRWGPPARVMKRAADDFFWFYLVPDRTWARAYKEFFFQDANQAFEFKMRWG